MYLLDTNICIYAMNNKYPSIAEKLAFIPKNDIYIPTVVVCELVYGAEKSKWGVKNRLKMERFLAPFNIIPFTREDAVTCGQIRAYLAKNGIPIGMYDVMIAAQGITRNMTVVTHNTNEFSRVPDIKIQDWLLN